MVCSFSIVNPSSYSRLRRGFKNALYECQKNIMGRKEYNAFIEPHIQEAESTLNVLRYCTVNPKAPGMKEYLRCIAYYNIACLSHICESNTTTKNDLASCEEQLMRTIEQIKQEGQLAFDIQQEREKTVELLTKVNKAYYQEVCARRRNALSGPELVAALINNHPAVRVLNFFGRLFS